MKVICLNGPPRCGKDTVGEILKEFYAAKGSVVSTLKFAEPLDSIAKAVLGISGEEYQTLREDKKDEKLEGHKVSPRDLLIAISEDLLKPLFGKTYFADKMADRIEKLVGLIGLDAVVLTDCGFQYEFDRFKERMQAIPEVELQLVQVRRPGTNFDNDSREFVYDDKQVSIENNGDIGDLSGNVWMQMGI